MIYCRGNQQLDTNPVHSSQLRRLSSCSYENILYDKSGSAHFVKDNQSSPSSSQRNSRAKVVTEHNSSTNNKHSWHSSQPSKSIPSSYVSPSGKANYQSHNNTSANDEYSLVKPAAIYKHTEQHSPARIVDTQQASTSLKKFNHTSDLHLATRKLPASSQPYVRVPTVHSAAPTSKANINDSFYAQYSKNRTSAASSDRTKSTSSAISALKVCSFLI